MSKDIRIVKLQRPISGNMEPAMLVYDESREYEAFIKWDDIFDELFGDDLKQYWRAEIKPDRTIELIEQVEPQPW